MLHHRIGLALAIIALRALPNKVQAGIPFKLSVSWVPC